MGRQVPWGWDARPSLLAPVPMKRQEIGGRRRHACGRMGNRATNSPPTHAGMHFLLDLAPAGCFTPATAKPCGPAPNPVRPDTDPVCRVNPRLHHGIPPIFPAVGCHSSGPPNIRAGCRPCPYAPPRRDQGKATLDFADSGITPLGQARGPRDPGQIANSHGPASATPRQLHRSLPCRFPRCACHSMKIGPVSRALAGRWQNGVDAAVAVVLILISARWRSCRGGFSVRAQAG